MAARFRVNRGMVVIHVQVHVKPDAVDGFRRASIENSRASLQEPGVVRFDVIQQVDDPTRFVLVEVYRDSQAQADHKGTPHYASWRDTVEPMMAEPRSSVKFSIVHPKPEEW